MALFSAGRGTYEIQILKDNRWVTEAIRNWEGDAKEHADKLLGNKAIAGVRVVLEASGGGPSRDQVIFEKKQDANADKPLRIKTIDVTPAFCRAPRDFFGLESRSIMNFMFRDYLEQVCLTPTEILHNHKELERLADRDNLLSQAVDNIARLQIKETKQELRVRKDEIYACIDQMTAQARHASELKLPKITASFGRLLRKVSDVEGDTPEYLAMVVLSRDLAGRSSWIAKLARLLELASVEKPGSRGLLLLDTVIADVLGANVVQELLGWQPSLGSAIIGMIDLAQGTYEPKDKDQVEITEALNALMEAQSLPASTQILVDRAIRQLKSPQPLHRSEPSQELHEYRRILAKLLVPGGILSGAKAAEAITLRGARFVEAGGATGRRTAINATLKVLPDRARGVMYLSELSNTPIAEEHLDDIVKQLDNVFGARVIDELCRRSMSPKDRMVTATGAFTAAKSSALPEDIRDRVADHIDQVLERYLVDESIIDRLDNPDSILRDRAVRLVKFCGAGVLPEGKAMARARKRIVEILRQPNFEQKFVEDIPDPQVAERVLRDFYKLLQKAGLS